MDWVPGVVLLLWLAGGLACWAWTHDFMLTLQMRRRLQLALCYLTSLPRRLVTLHEFQQDVEQAYAAHDFQRPLQPAELEQLALRDGFPPAAAAMLACQEYRAARSSSSSHVGVPSWCHRHFMWWLQRQLATLDLVRDEWEQTSPQLIAGFDVTRATAEALLFRRSKGTCLVRPGSEVGGIVVSLRPDRARLPEERRTPASYFGSVTPARLAAAAYELAEQPWALQRRSRREGAVVHVFVPDSSLRLRGGLWGCLRRMRHTKSLLDISAGRVVRSREAFELGAAAVMPAPAELEALRRQALLHGRQ